MSSPSKWLKSSSPQKKPTTTTTTSTSSNNYETTSVNQNKNVVQIKLQQPNQQKQQHQHQEQEDEKKQYYHDSTDNSSIQLEKDHKKIVNLLEQLEDSEQQQQLTILSLSSDSTNNTSSNKNIEQTNHSKQLQNINTNNYQLTTTISDYDMSIGDLSIEELLNAPIEMPSMLIGENDKIFSPGDDNKNISNDILSNDNAHNDISPIFTRPQTATIKNSQLPTQKHSHSDGQKSDQESAISSIISDNTSLSSFSKPPIVPPNENGNHHKHVTTATRVIKNSNMDTILQDFVQDADEYMSYLDSLKTLDPTIKPSEVEEPKESVISKETYSISFGSEESSVNNYDSDDDDNKNNRTAKKDKRNVGDAKEILPLSLMQAQEIDSSSNDKAATTNNLKHELLGKESGNKMKENPVLNLDRELRLMHSSLSTESVSRNPWSDRSEQSSDEKERISNLSKDYSNQQKSIERSSSSNDQQTISSISSIHITGEDSYQDGDGPLGQKPYMTFDDFLATQEKEMQEQKEEFETPIQKKKLAVVSKENVNTQEMASQRASLIPVLSQSEKINSSNSRPLSSQSLSKSSSRKITMAMKEKELERTNSKIFPKSLSSPSSRQLSRSQSKENTTTVTSQSGSSSKQRKSLPLASSSSVAASKSNLSSNKQASDSIFHSNSLRQSMDGSASNSSFLSQDSIIVPIHEIDDVQNTVKSLRSELSETRTLLQTKSDQVNKLKQELDMVEKIRKVEQENLESTIRSSMNLSQLNLSDEAQSRVQKLLKDNQELERLIHGYQTENEKLVNQVKVLQNQVTEANARFVLKKDQLVNEINTLKRQLQSGPKIEDLGSVTWKVKYEQLQEDHLKLKDELDSVKTELNENSKSLKLRIEFLEAEKRSLEQTQQQRLNEKSNDTSNARTQEDAEKVIQELKSNHIANQEVLKSELYDKNVQINKLQNEVKALRSQLSDNFKPLKEASSIGTQENSMDYKRLADALVVIEEEKKNLIRSFDEERKELERKIKFFQEEKENPEIKQIKTNSEDQSNGHASSFTPLNRNHEQLIQLTQENLTLEKTISEQINHIQKLRQERDDVEISWRKRVYQLNQNLVAQEQKNLELTKQLTNSTQFLNDETSYRNQIEELTIELEKSKTETTKLHNQLQVSEATRKAIHENTILILKQAQEESAKIALQQHERSLQILRAQTNSQSNQILDMEMNRLIKLVKQAERENVRLKEENQRLDAELTELKQLVGSVEDIQLLAKRLEELENENLELEERLKQSKENWSPEQLQHGFLEKKIRTLETRYKHREEELEKLIKIRNSHLKAEKEKFGNKYKVMVEKKNQQILFFKSQLDSLTQSLSGLKSQS